MLAFRSLDPHCARSGNLIVGDGMKNGFPAPNKELAINRKTPLDRESPIQVRIHFPPATNPANSGTDGPRILAAVASRTNGGRSAGIMEYPARLRISAPQIAATIAAEGPIRAELSEVTVHQFRSMRVDYSGPGPPP